jgi:septum formation protein
MRLILASASQRRRDLLSEAGIAFEVLPADIDESPLPGETPAAHVLRLARAKAAGVAAGAPRRLVLGADTVVALGTIILGKPDSLDHARAMLAQLAGREHDVLTGVCLRRLEPPADTSWVARTRVRFKPLSAAAIERYCALVNPLDKAGAYAIQEYGDMLVSDIRGLRSTVIGLPVEEVLERLDNLVS